MLSFIGSVIIIRLHNTDLASVMKTGTLARFSYSHPRTAIDIERDQSLIGWYAKRPISDWVVTERSTSHCTFGPLDHAAFSPNPKPVSVVTAGLDGLRTFCGASHIYFRPD